MIEFNKFVKLMLNPFTALVMSCCMVLSYLYLDQNLILILITHNVQKYWSWLEYMTKFGLGFIYLILFFIMGLWFRFGYKNVIWEARSWFLWLCVTMPSVINLCIKIICSRARPIMWLDYKQYGFYWLKMNGLYWSFPSGHTTSIMGLAFGLGFLFPKKWIIFVLTGLLIAITRILLLQHYASDVLTAVYITLLEVGFLVYMLRKTKLFASIIKNKESM